MCATHRVPGLVVGDHALLVLGDGAVGLQARYDALQRVVEVDIGDRVAIGARRPDGGFVADVLEVGTGQARGGASDGRELDRIVDGLVAHVHVEDLLAREEVGRRDVDLAVEAAGPQQRRVERVEPVRRGHDDDVGALEAVQLDEQLIERLILLAVVPDVLARGADGVELVDEDDRRSVLAGRLEELADARGAEAREHLDEGGGRLREEGRAGFRRDRLGEQRLAGARRPVQEHAARDAGAEALEAHRVAQELDDLGQLRLGLFDAGDVVPAHDRLGVGLELTRRRARHHLHEPPHQVHQDPQQQRGPPEDDDYPDLIEQVGDGRRNVRRQHALFVGRNPAELERALRRRARAAGSGGTRDRPWPPGGRRARRHRP